ncbi:hypothetical protein TorRG33x02_136320 [Trema orientale]|uniref:Uncharacterized protein n=1 Tax=Trema orientale TaxID=63057 RepID=A0A2P5EYG8_TREOI|nr:hypothetical protein TorRG33x02_136320 [Trema orientale]
MHPNSVMISEEVAPLFESAFTSEVLACFGIPSLDSFFQLFLASCTSFSSLVMCLTKNLSKLGSSVSVCFFLICPSLKLSSFPAPQEDSLRWNPIPELEA